MRILRTSAFALARFLISAVFLAAAINKMFHWGEFEKILNATLNDWLTFGVLPEIFQNVFIALAHWTPALLILSTSFELLGGLFLLLGLKEKLGASLLILFLIPTTILFHPFWLFEGSEREIATPMFLKNLSIMGGLILILLNGAQNNMRAAPSSFR